MAVQERNLTMIQGHVQMAKFKLAYIMSQYENEHSLIANIV